MKLIQNYLTENDCYNINRKITVKGLMIHSIGTPQPKASVLLNTWNKSGVQMCVHAFIDGNDGTVYQTLPWNHRGWHGGGSSNNTHIGVEMCEPSTIKYTTGAYFTDLNPAKTKEVVLRTYKSAVELFAYLCKEYNLNPLKDIVGHKEGHMKGIASNHGDPDHLWSKFGLSMDGFRKDVQAQMKKGVSVTHLKSETPVNSENSMQKGMIDVKVSVLKKGSKGGNVKALQALLIGYGFSCGSSGTDGSFGTATETAVKAYQKANNLAVDGSVGTNTWNKLLGIK